MKNFFEFFGFLSTACLSGIIMFLFLGRTERDGVVGELFRTDKVVSASVEEEVAPASPRKMSEALPEMPRISRNVASRRDHNKTVAPEAPSSEAALAELYNDADYVNSTVKKWKTAVADAAEVYSANPVVLMAHVLVQDFLGDYTAAALKRDAARHAGERVMANDVVLRRYAYAWSMKALMKQYRLEKHFPSATPEADIQLLSPHKAGVASANAKTTKSLPRLGGEKPMEKRTSGREEGFKKMVAKQYGKKDWKTVGKDPKAMKKVKMLNTASRIK